MNSERMIHACEAQLEILLDQNDSSLSIEGSSRALSVEDTKSTQSVAKGSSEIVSLQTAATNAGNGKVLYQAAAHCSFGGNAKRARPRLVAAFGNCVDAAEEELVAVAVAGELIHTASLVHDDVIDDGTLRRGRPTVNTVWNNLTAVLTGDLMFSLAFNELASAPRVVMNSATHVLREMSCAAIDEANSRGAMDLSLAAWSKIAEGKTGALFGWCGASAAHVAGDAAAAKKFDSCGRKLGIAFQLADDLKDLIAPGGKDRFQDIKNQNPSYPLLWAFAHDANIREAFAAAWAQDEMSDSDVDRLGKLVLSSPAIAAAEDALVKEVNAALDALGAFATTEGGKEILQWASALTATGAVAAFATQTGNPFDAMTSSNSHTPNSHSPNETNESVRGREGAA